MKANLTLSTENNVDIVSTLEARGYTKLPGAGAEEPSKAFGVVANDHLKEFWLVDEQCYQMTHKHIKNQQN